MVNRVQLSLMIDDEELYNSFILPCKSTKSLHGIIIRCLQAYYYNEEVRNQIEGVSLESTMGDVQVTSTQDICDNIRASLAMQSFLSEQLQQTMELGVEDFTDILSKTNDFAKESGVARSNKSEYGDGVLQLEMKKPQTQEVAGTQAVTPNNDDLGAKVDYMMQMLSALVSFVGFTPSGAPTDASLTQGSVHQAPVANENTSLNAQAQVSNVQPTVNVENKPTAGTEDASDDLLASLKSLSGIGSES